MGIYKPRHSKKYNPAIREGRKLFAKLGEYRIKDVGKNSLYVGEACNLDRRMKQHIRSGQ